MKSFTREILILLRMSLTASNWLSGHLSHSNLVDASLLRRGIKQRKGLEDLYDAINSFCQTTCGTEVIVDCLRENRPHMNCN